MELVAELRAGGGRAREVRVRCAAEAGGEPRGELRELRRGLGELQERVAELLAPLVLEQQRRGAAGGAPSGGEWRRRTAARGCRTWEPLSAACRVRQVTA